VLKKLSILLFINVNISTIALFIYYKNKLNLLENIYLIIIFITSLIFLLLIFKNKISNVIIFNFFAIYIILIGFQEFEIQSGYTWNRLEKTDIESKKGKDVFPHLGPHAWLKGLDLPTVDGAEIIPLSNAPNSTIILCREDDGWQEYNSDRFGHRNIDSNWDLPEVNSLFIGDSFVLGHCVPEENHFVFHAEKYGPVIRLGGLQGPLTEYAAFKEFIVNQNKKINNIFWVFFEGNDIYSTYDNRNADIDYELSYEILTNYLVGKDNNLLEINNKLWTEVQIILDNQTSAYDWDVRSPSQFTYFKKSTGFYILMKLQEFLYFRFADVSEPKSFIRQSSDSQDKDSSFIYKLTGNIDYYFDTFYNPPPERKITEEERIEALNKILENVSNYGKIHNSNMYFVFFPSEPQLLKNSSHILKSEVINIATKNNFNVIDIEEIFSNNPGEIGKLFAKGHYSKEGYSLVINEIEKILIEK
tara:strand:+ start:2708 stop:4126 length:1419 start_codon:yes stop_codon:yes gene_type:complete